MAKTQLAGKPWSPCDELDPLAEQLQEWMKRPAGNFTASDLRHAYRQRRTEQTHRWLEFNIGPDYSDRFDRRTMDPLKALVAWELRCQRGDWPSIDAAEEAYDAICEDIAETSRWLHQLSAMIRAKLDAKAVPGAARIEPEPSVPPLSGRPTNLQRVVKYVMQHGSEVAVKAGKITCDLNGEPGHIRIGKGYVHKNAKTFEPYGVHGGSQGYRYIPPLG